MQHHTSEDLNPHNILCTTETKTTSLCPQVPHSEHFFPWANCTFSQYIHVAMGWTTQGSMYWGCKRFFSSPKWLQQLWGLSSLLLYDYQGFLPEESNRCDMKLKTLLYTVPRLQMSVPTYMLARHAQRQLHLLMVTTTLHQISPKFIIMLSSHLWLCWTSGCVPSSFFIKTLNIFLMSLHMLHKVVPPTRKKKKLLWMP